MKFLTVLLSLSAVAISAVYAAPAEGAAVSGSSTNQAVKDASLTASVSAQYDLVGVSALAPNDKSVLILGTTNGQEAATAAALGYTPVLVTPAQWGALTPKEFASYRAIILGDRFCSSVEDVAAAEANVNIWSPIVKGNVIIDGTDPSFHIAFGFNNAGAQKYQRAAIAYAANQKALTGAYISLSCYYSSFTPTTVNVLKGFGNFKAVASSTCDGNQRIVAQQAGTPLTAVSNANLRGWLCATHEWFSTFPASFTRYAVFDDANAGNNKPYILVRAANCCLGTYTGSACCGGVTGNDVFTCANQKATLINTCAPPVPKCQNVALGVVNGLSVQSTVCNV